MTSLKAIPNRSTQSCCAYVFQSAGYISILQLTALSNTMKALLNHLSKFITVSLQLYSPLPFEFTADLHTLNAYLKTYSDKQQKLLEGFVNRLVQKVASKTKFDAARQETCPTVEHFDDALKHYNSCTFKYPELRLQIPTEPSQKSFVQQFKVHSYRSSARSKIEDGIKPNRHKFGTRDKAKHLNVQANKENQGIFANSAITKDNYLQQPLEDRSLKFIKSEAELMMPSSSNAGRTVSMQNKEQKKCKTKTRYESIDNKVSPISTQLKIKIKAKPTLQLPKFIENVNQLEMLIRGNEQQISNLLSQIDFFGESLDEAQLANY